MEKENISSTHFLEAFRQQVHILGKNQIESFQNNTRVDWIMDFKEKLLLLEKETLRNILDSGIHNQLELVKDLQDVRLDAIRQFQSALNTTK